MLIKRIFFLLVTCLLLNSVAVSDDHCTETAKQLDMVFNDPSFSRAFWGVKVVSLDTGRIIYQKDAHKLFIPASNMKILTAASALRFLGEGHVFKTMVSTNGVIEAGVLKGDLIIVGSGDPSLGARFVGNNPHNPLSGDPWAVFSGCAEKLKELGIRSIEGNIIGDDQLFEQIHYGDGWTWDDMYHAYSAGFGALQFNESAAYIEIRPGKAPGSPVSARIIPRLESMSVVSTIETGPPECESRLSVLRDGRSFFLSGQLPSGTGMFYRGVALPEPTAYFLDMLRETLERNGISIKGKSIDADNLDEYRGAGATRLIIHTSPPFEEILRVLLEVSQNQFAETVFRLLDKKEDGKSDEGAVRTMEEILSSMGVPSDSYEIVDGSGLSRGNLLSPDSIVRVLQHMYRNDEDRKFVKMLPKSGLKGTIKGRMNGTRAAEKVSAKTGTLSWVRALSGYLETEKGEMLAFSMLVNNYNQPRQAAEYLQDQAMEILVGYE